MDVGAVSYMSLFIIFLFDFRVRDYTVRVGYIRGISDLDANFGCQCVHADAIFMSASEANFGWLSN